MKDFPPRTGDIANDPKNLEAWLDKLGLRQNWDLLNTLTTPASGDKFGILDVSDPAPSAFKAITYAALLAVIQTAVLAAVPAPTGWKVVSKGTCSALTTLDITGIDSTYKFYKLFLRGFVPATNSVDMWLRVSEDGGSTFKSGGTDYAYALTGQGSNSSTGAAQILLTPSSASIHIASANAAGVEMEITFTNPSGSSAVKCFTWRGAMMGITASFLYSINGNSLFQLDTNAVNAIQILFSSGNIASGDWVLMGLKET